MSSVAEQTESLQMTPEEIAAEKKEHISVIDFKMVTFSLADKDYAIDIMKVKEIAKAGRFTYVPNTSPFVLGVYNLRGDIIPIIDLRLFFNIEVPERKNDHLENMLIVSVEEQTFGVVVDGIDKVVGIHSSSIQPPHPLFGDINIKYIYGVVESNNNLYILLDIDRIFGVRSAPKSEQPSNTEGEKSPDSANVYVEHANSELIKQANFSTEDDPSQGSEIDKVVDKEVSHFVQKEVVQEQIIQEDPLKSEETSVVLNSNEYNFVVSGLQSLKKFYVTPLNDQWIHHRFIEWEKERGFGNTQLQNISDAENFLSTFQSQCSNTFWSKEYADAIYKTLPDNNAKQITVWNPGCGKGYEAFSLACLLKKRYPDSRIRIYAHDIDLLCVSNASLLSVPQSIADSWYKPYIVKTVSGDFAFSAEIKDMILFEYHDCANANAMPAVDLLFCRDMLSYLPPESQDNLFEDFEDKLKGNGIIILGENETLTNRVLWQEKMVGSIVVYAKQ